MKIALHICCAVCASGAAERLLQVGYQVRGFFYNPNIFPEAEYRLRLENARRVALKLGFPLDEGPYEPGVWTKAVAGLENEPEGGKRCPVCIKIRLEKTFEYMLNSGCDSFTSTLTMGPNKPAKIIGQIGWSVAGDRFANMDFKKQEGIKRAVALAKNWDLYRQHYCGCQFSLRDEELRRAKQIPKPSDST
jgi:epoxyqueuosine reductase